MIKHRAHRRFPSHFAKDYVCAPVIPWLDLYIVFSPPPTLHIDTYLGRYLRQMH